MFSLGITEKILLEVMKRVKKNSNNKVSENLGSSEEHSINDHNSPNGTEDEEWILTNNSSFQDSGADNYLPPVQASSLSANETSAGVYSYNYNLFSQLLSEGATRGVFGWSRLTGCPRSERPI